MNHSKLLRVVSFILTLTLMLSIATAALAYKTIPYGEQSDAVRKMQNALYDEGFYNGDVDGKFGPATKRAVEAFQKSIGLTSDGKPGNQTLTALYDGVWNSGSSTSSTGNYNTKTTNPRSLYYGCSGSRVSDLQLALDEEGYYNGDIDGRYGASTYTAVQRFQRDNNLTADGIAGVKTLAKLGLSTSSSSDTSSSGTMILALGSRGSEVKRLQQYLRDKGYSISDSDSVFGEGTRQALISWQSSRGLATTGALTEKDYNRYIK